jgi:preprotein translocase subunit SecA
MLILPTSRLGHHRTRTPRRLATGLLRIWERLTGAAQTLRMLRWQLWRDAGKVWRAAEQLRLLDDAALASAVAEAQARVRTARKINAKLEREALSVIGAAAARTVRLAPYRVQYMGALALWRGYLAEMATGEGKTLSVALAAVLCGWRGKPSHVLTSNDYLAERDCTEMGALFTLCGVRASFVVSAKPPNTRRADYAADLVYTTGKELLADFLRDRLVIGLADDLPLLTARMLGGQLPEEGPVMRGIHTVLVDEADSVLIDDAVTPLIISRKVRHKTMEEAARLAHKVGQALQPDSDYEVDYRTRAIHFTADGEDQLTAAAVQMPPLWRSVDRCRELVRQALTAHWFYTRGVEYIVREDKVVIIDLPTGRLKVDSTWQHGLHQAVEVKEGLPISQPAETMASMSFQNFFRLFPRLGGLTGTARRAEPEFWRIYRLPVVRIPTHRPCIRRMHPTVYCADAAAKYAAVAAEIAARHAEGRPVLAGVGSVAASEQLATVLRAQGLPYNLLNAERHAEEAAIIAEAGQAAKITIATNMAGRGTDIRLVPHVAAAGGLHVIACERMDSARTDRQLAGRSARQGDPGSTRRFVAMDDDLLRRAWPQAVLARVADLLRAGVPGATVLAAVLTNRAQRRAENIAQSSRESVVRRDRWLEDSLPFRS